MYSDEEQFLNKLKYSRNIEEMKKLIFNRVINYCNKCLSNEILVCKKHRWAIERFLKDIENTSKYYLDRTELLKFYIFATKFPLRTGKYSKKKILLVEFQLFIVANLLCIKSKDGNLRKYKKGYIQIARKQGKSMLQGLILLYIAICDTSEQQETYISGWNSTQSQVTFREVEYMLDNCFDTKIKNSYKKSYGTILFDNSNFIKPLTRESGRTGEGTNPSLAVIDEYKDHVDTCMLDTQLTGQGQRKSPLTVIITTAGRNLNYPCYSIEYKTVSKIINPDYIDLNDDSYFIFILENEQDDKIEDSSVWVKSNPMIMNEPSLLNKLEEDFKLAKISPEKMITFKTKNLNMWVNMRTCGYMDMQKWNKASREFTLEDFRGEDCIIAIDLSKCNDLTSIGMEFYRDGEYYVFQHSFIPEETYNEVVYKTSIRYDLFLENSELTVCDGSIITYREVFEYIKDLAQKFNIIWCVYDSWNCVSFAQRLYEELGLNVTEFSQSMKAMNSPTKAFRNDIYQDLLHHNNDTLLNWCMSNVVLRTTNDDNVKPTKDNKDEKIDPIICLIMCHAFKEYIESNDDIFISFDMNWNE